MAINRWMDVEDLVCPYGRMFFIHMKESSADTCYNTVASENMAREAAHKRPHIIQIHFCEVFRNDKSTKKVNTWDGEQNMESVIGHRQSIWGDRNVLKLDRANGCPPPEKKWLNFILWVGFLYLRKALQVNLADKGIWSRFRDSRLLLNQRCNCLWKSQECYRSLQVFPHLGHFPWPLPLFWPPEVFQFTPISCINGEPPDITNWVLRKGCGIELTPNLAEGPLGLCQASGHAYSLFLGTAWRKKENYK